MKKLIAAVAFTVVAASASLATAATPTLYTDGFWNDSTINSDFDLQATTGIEVGDDIKKYSTWNSFWSGLGVDGAPASLEYEYLGSEAANDNTFVLLNPHSDLFSNDGSTAVYDTYRETTSEDGLLDFEFETEWVKCGFRGCRDKKAEAENGGWTDWGLSIGVFEEKVGQSYIVLFGDGSGDHDMDDMAVRISVVPVPAALPLFGAALIGMGFLARRRKQKAALQA
jgi:hypothetical protein